MSKEELITLVNKIKLCEGSEEDLNSLMDIFLKNVSDLNAINYIFGKQYDDLSAEEIVDKALSYIPINLR